MSKEADLIARLRGIATHHAARGLNDDAAVLASPLGRDLVLTHDVLVEGVHYLPDDPAGDVAWKLLAVNLSDLAAMGAIPLGVLIGFTLAGDPAWDNAFVEGLARALNVFDVPLLGGDTVSGRGARVLGLTALGQVAAGSARGRDTAVAGDDLWVSGTVGDAGLGLRIAQGELTGAGVDLKPLLKRYRLPMPRLALGRAIAPHCTAMMDVSDGLLIDAGRMAAASGLGITIVLEDVPLSAPFLHLMGDKCEARIAAATAGDDYELLFAAPSSCCDAVIAAASLATVNITRIGKFTSGGSLTVKHHGDTVDLPDRVGWEHDG